jgi:hypothetical protein
VSQVAQGLCGRQRRRSALLVDRQPGRRVQEQADPQPPGIGADLLDVRAIRFGRAVPGEPVGTAHDVEHEGRVVHGAGDRSSGRRVFPAPDELGHASPARLEAHEAGDGRRDPDRSAAVAGVRHRGEPGRDGRRRAAARPAGGVRQVPRVARLAVPGVLGDGQGAELGRVRPAEGDRAGIEEELDLGVRDGLRGVPDRQ